MINFWIRAAVAAIFVGMLQAGPLVSAASAQGVKTGLLTCQVASGFGWIIGSTRTMQCKFSPGHGHIEEYNGTISKVGIDIGYLGACVIAWAVVAPNSAPGPGALSGNYFGATAQAAAMVGGGVNVMTGGFRSSIALQPISVMGNTGLYVGAGIASMTLDLADY
ncbi:MAG TPA: DUF992 domain-containing protein [Verrucomicrobiae bacterium]|jgi:hypothetical protein|nr:DUF992 domain-containing protein [Verrucomicrobiae bacterium]